MFFRRERPKTITFEQRTDELRKSGFHVEPRPDGSLLVSRDCYAARLQNDAGSPKVVERAGVLTPHGIGKLVDGGFQKFFLTADGHKKPALASDLKGIHAFQEDLREALGLTSLYNESLGTVSTQYLYDRVKDRDRGVPKRAWEQ
jgi:hypothetical protein